MITLNTCNTALLLCFSFIQDGTTPLMITAAAGHLECCLELLRQGANPSQRRKVKILILLSYFESVKIVNRSS